MHFAGVWENVLFFASYVPSGPLTWVGYGWATVAGRVKMQLLDKPRPLPTNPQRVSVMIPAKDEEGRIRGCIQSALDQDWPSLEVIAIDDRSVDRTGAILDEMAAADPRLTVIHVQPGTLGPGWTGKNNALFAGAKRATGDWLLFVDSDVVLDRTAVSRTVTVAQYKKYDLFSVLPRLETHTLWEGMLIPLCSAAAATMYLIALNNNDKFRRFGFANGQYLMMPRASYDAIGGHEVVKDRFCEDTEIARLVKERGMRSRVSWGEDICAVRMYSSLPAIIKGWSRIYYAAKVGQKKHILGAINFLLTSCFTAYAALIYGIYRWAHPHGNMLDHAWLYAAAFHLLVMSVVLGVMYRWSKNSPLYALLFPVGGTLLLWTLAKALYTCFTKRLDWRGTSYSHVMNQNLAAPSA